MDDPVTLICVALAVGVPLGAIAALTGLYLFEATIAAKSEDL